MMINFRLFIKKKNYLFVRDFCLKQNQFKEPQFIRTKLYFGNQFIHTMQKAKKEEDQLEKGS